jgi:hypothetical protein
LSVRCNIQILHIASFLLFAFTLSCLFFFYFSLLFFSFFFHYKNKRKLIEKFKKKKKNKKKSKKFKLTCLIGSFFHVKCINTYIFLLFVFFSVFFIGCSLVNF